MYIEQETCDALNGLLQKTFQANAFMDNCAYWLDANNFVKATGIVHENFAHKFPEWADGISDLMIKLGCRPVRRGLSEEAQDYEDFKQLFFTVKLFFEEYRASIYEVIDIAEMNNERELINYFDDYLVMLALYLKQVNIWDAKAKEYESAAKFDKDFDKFTII